MTAVVVVAGRNDSAFAEALRADLAQAGHDVAVAESLPSQPGPHVVLLWSAPLALTHIIDAQALIGLWSDDHLLIARRDEAPLPLGLRDLPSLPPTAHEPDFVAAIRAELGRSIGLVVGSATAPAPAAKAVGSSRTSATGNQEIELEFWRAIRDGSDPDDFELYLQQFPRGIYAALAKRRLAVLKGLAPGEASAESVEEQRKEAEEALKREAEVRRKLVEEKAKLAAQLAATEAEYSRRETAGDPSRVVRAQARAKAETRARIEDGAAKREAGLKKLADAPRAKRPMASIAAVVVAVIGIGGGAYYFSTAEKRTAESAALAMLEEASKASKELQAAQANQLEALKALERAREAEQAARKTGDDAKLKEAREAARRAEEEAKKQADFVKQREAAAADARRKAEDASRRGEQAEAKKAAPKAEVAVASAPPAAAVKSEAPEAEEPKAEEPKAEAPKAAAAAAAPIVAEVPAKKASPMSRSERERLADEEAARKALAAAGKAPAAQVAVVASAAPSASGPAEAPAKAAIEHDALYQQAQALEQEGNAAQAIRIYRRAARAGSGKAAQRLGDIYDRGVSGVSRDYAESLQWYETARQLGETIPTGFARGGGGGGGPVAQAPAQTAPPIVAEVPAPAPRSVEPVPAKSAPVRRETAKSEAVKSMREPKPAAATTVEIAKPAPPAAVAPPVASAPSPAPAPAVPESSPAQPEHTLYLYFSVILLLIVVAILWRRSRRSPAPAAQPLSQPQPEAKPQPQSGRPVAQASADASTLFVSYSHKDRGRVEPIVSAIEGMGRRVWMDRSDITGQAGWAGQIVRAIRECRAVVLMASPHSYASDQVVRELYLAMNHRKTIVPIEIEPADLPDELQYILAPFQHHRLSGGETRDVLGRALAAV